MHQPSARFFAQISPAFGLQRRLRNLLQTGQCIYEPSGEYAALIHQNYYERVEKMKAHVVAFLAPEDRSLNDFVRLSLKLRVSKKHYLGFYSFRILSALGYLELQGFCVSYHVITLGLLRSSISEYAALRVAGLGRDVERVF